MNFMVRPIRPGYLIFQNCICQRIINSQRTVLSPVNIKVSCYKSRHYMGETHITNGNSLPQSSSLLQPKNVELTTLSDQNFSSSSENQTPTTDEVKTLSNKDKLKRAIKDYGATVIVFHITISLMSLGTSYLVISSGVDVGSLLAKVGLDPESTLTAGASTFVVAYAVHKLFAPVRISITLGATPFIVRYLRRIGVLKPPKV
ncbi:protein FAM210B, mitochondrial-like [Macrosteles quadrilineatus]|uniref:protein FAM210B, mitochondrial-like n=1 Tax=Macrosteles quadrilineatus TaxID=74068 RepID=UPI0023E30176|nr:protein FAM210B, mitochondrial-like [Macrosteles quadrilineatus]XP_054283085.1 protein FAM210B, mitochondrial-like [Macrosteles quadrilineatus]XP_054283086.1 protein FAM210B, mitochondrial-like [Macrosteles quadrilineatus]XP_054283087.1 protein FAM210B, mitochondrial-like [Macrosteles quadrilineatus]